MSRTVNRYRYFCTSESNYVYQWDTQKPLSCINGSNHTIDVDSLTIVDSISENTTSIANVLKSPYDELRVVEKTPVIDLKSFYGKTTLRDIYTLTGTATIENLIGDSEYALSVSSASDVACLKSAERGRYISGQAAEVGVAIRIPSTLTGNQVLRWGAFDDNNGFYYKLTSSGWSVCILRAGVETEIPQSQFNGDKLDGSGPSKVNLNMADGHIYNIVFSWYGYGIVDFTISTETLYHEQKPLSVHKYFSEGVTSVKNPNLPVRVCLENNATSSPITVYVSGRQYSVIGKYVPQLRVNSAYVMLKNINQVQDNLNWYPIMSIRRKQGYEGNPSKIFSADLSLDSIVSQVIQIRAKTSLTGASWGNIPDQIPTETIMEFDSSATDVSGGIVIWSGFLAASSSTLRQVEDLMYIFSENDIVTVCGKSSSATNVTISAVLRWTEEW
jgi:hypothetical protein